MGNQVVVLGGRGADGHHLESVEMVTLPLLDDWKKSKKQDAKKEAKTEKQEESTQEQSSPVTPLPEEWKRLVEGTVQMAHQMKPISTTNQFKN